LGPENKAGSCALPSQATCVTFFALTKVSNGSIKLKQLQKAPAIHSCPFRAQKMEIHKEKGN